MMTKFSLLIVTLIVLLAKPSFSLKIWHPNPDFLAGAGHSLLGNAHLAGGGNSVQLNLPTSSSFGIILRSTPFKFSPSTSFYSNFTFEIGNGVALVIIPSDFPSKFAENSSSEILDVNRFLGIEFDVNVCKIVSSRVSNVSKTNNVLKNGVKLSSWIDYRASLKRLDVRLSKSGDPKPVEPLISYRINLGEMWKGQEALLGLASSNGNPKQITAVYSWRSEIKDVPKWLHSNPVNPQGYSTVSDDEQSGKKRGCFLSGFLFAMSCGGLAALALFFVWSFVADRQKTRGQPAVCPVDLKYEKISVLEVNSQEAGMK